MIPTYQAELDPELPRGFGFWVPTDEDIEQAGDGGLGFFQNTWLLGDVEPSEASVIVDEEAELIDAVDALASDAEEFEDVVSAVEWGNPADISIAGIRERPGWPALDAVFPSEEGISSHLELGVGGLSWALAAVGLVPVASCRSHPEHSWADTPVVFFATDRSRAEVLQRLVAEHGCGLGDGGDRPKFMTVYARDVRSMNTLARALLDSAKEFGPGTIIARSSHDEFVSSPPIDPDQLALPII